MKITVVSGVRSIFRVCKSVGNRLWGPCRRAPQHMRYLVADFSRVMAKRAGERGLNRLAEKFYLFSHSMQYWRNEEVRVPSAIAIETIMGCNAACTMCPYPVSTREKGLMKEELFNKVVDQIVALPDQPKVALHFLGEPLMDKKLEHRIRILKQRGIREVEVVTNASLLTEKRAKSLMEAGVDLLNVDLESLKKDVYESIRIGLDFDIVIKNILGLFEIRNQMDAETSISILFIEQEINKDETEAFLDFFSSIIRPEKGDHIRVFPMHNFGGYGSAIIPPSNMPCYSLYTSFNVLKDGQVALCCVDEDADFEMGNVNEKNIHEIFNDAPFQHLRKLHEAGGRWISKKCAECNVPEVAQAQRIYGAGGKPLRKKGKALTEQAVM